MNSFGIKQAAYVVQDDAIQGKRPAIFMIHAREGMTDRTREIGEKFGATILDDNGKPLAKVQALEREYVAPKLDDDYGQQSYIDRKLANSRMELKDALKKKNLRFGMFSMK